MLTLHRRPLLASLQKHLLATGWTSIKTYPYMSATRNPKPPAYVFDTVSQPHSPRRDGPAAVHRPHNDALPALPPLMLAPAVLGSGGAPGRPAARMLSMTRKLSGAP
ncbi:hypothetical protein C8R44DRAFT_734753 [Mycena epipterygia]|nr:hypothetical protein C8R44DRAFT_734753 [Mycena epipterygia]